MNLDALLARLEARNPKPEATDMELSEICLKMMIAEVKNLRAELLESQQLVDELIDMVENKSVIVDMEAAEAYIEKYKHTVRH